jgi:Activator of Hsp90 ATPase homolog 1-like protein
MTYSLANTNSLVNANLLRQDRAAKKSRAAMSFRHCPSSIDEAALSRREARSLPQHANRRNRGMIDRSFTTAFSVDQTPEEAFNAINDVRGWWSGDIEGSSAKLGDEFSYRHKNVHYSRQKLTAFVPQQKVVWDVLDSRLSFAEDKAEWTGTKIIFEIARKGNKTEIRFTHSGLVPDFECFEGCSGAWGYYINTSLRNFISGGRERRNFG